MIIVIVPKQELDIAVMACAQSKLAVQDVLVIIMSVLMRQDIVLNHVKRADYVIVQHRY